MGYKKAKAVLYETVESKCPHCGADYKDTEPGWRDKPQENGEAFYPVRCQKVACKKLFRVSFFTHSH